MADRPTPPEGDMLTAVAKALHYEMERLEQRGSADWESLSEGDKHYFYSLAEAALGASKRPATML